MVAVSLESVSKIYPNGFHAVDSIELVENGRTATSTAPVVNESLIIVE